MRRLTIALLTLLVLLSLGSAAVMAQQVHVVQRGETLYSVARRYDRTVAEIAGANGLSEPYIIHAGNQLTIPAPGGSSDPAPAPAPAPAPQPATATYTVQRGDSLAIIAAQFNINYFELARMNGIANPDVLRVGQVLQVPGPPPPPEPAPVEAPGEVAPVGPAPPSTANTSGFELGGQALSFAHPGHMKNARMTWVKRQVKWHGGPASNHQHLIDSAHGNGFKVLLSVIGDKNQISGNPGAYYQNFANFVAGLARGGADAIEVWNEMNIDREWPAGQISGANYVQMLSAAYNAIKGANSSTMVISGAPRAHRLLPGLRAQRRR